MTQSKAYLGMSIMENPKVLKLKTSPISDSSSIASAGHPVCSIDQDFWKNSDRDIKAIY